MPASNSRFWNLFLKRNISYYILGSLCIVGCGPDSKPDLTCNGSINAKDVEGIKPCIQANWKIHYKRSPSGTKHALVNSFINIKSNDSIYVHLEGDIFAESLISSEDLPTLNFKNWKDELLNWRFEKFDIDTLFLSAADVRYALVKSSSSPSINCNQKLSDKALNQIKSCIEGNWQLHYRYGGFSGNDKDYYTTPTFLGYNSRNDSIRYGAESNYSTHKVQWNRTIDIIGQQTYVMGFEYDGIYPVRWVISEIRQDTLVLFDNWPDGYAYFLSRKN